MSIAHIIFTLMAVVVGLHLSPITTLADEKPTICGKIFKVAVRMRLLARVNHLFLHHVGTISSQRVGPVCSLSGGSVFFSFFLTRLSSPVLN
jgi:hypothetical protein